MSGKEFQEQYVLSLETERDQLRTENVRLRAERDRLTLWWTSDKPTEPGWYWTKGPCWNWPEGTARIVEVVLHDGKCRVAAGLLSRWFTRPEGAEWAGPIPLPIMVEIIPERAGELWFN
jgi:hypothetical protein